MGVLGPGGVAGDTVAVSVTGDPYAEVGGATVRVDVVGSGLTTSEQVAELAANGPVGLKLAWMVCVPAVEPV